MEYPDGHQVLLRKLDHSDFSNFAAYPIDIDGIAWASVEHYYQA